MRITVKGRKEQTTGYAKDINWRVCVVPVALLVAMLLILPTTTMTDVGTEYGIVPEVVEDIAGMYWSDSEWFIIGSVVFAMAFVKTGMDKRLNMMLFSRPAVPKTSVIGSISIAVPAPLSAFVSDHALAAIFQPVGLMLFRGGGLPGQETTEPLRPVREWTN